MERSREDDTWDTIIKLGLLLGAIWLGSEFLKSVKRCRNCGHFNDKNSFTCRKCGANI